MSPKKKDPDAPRTVVVNTAGHSVEVPEPVGEAQLTEMLDGGAIIACIIRSADGDLGVSLFEEPSVPLLQALQAVTKALKALVPPQPPPC